MLLDGAPLLTLAESAEQKQKNPNVLVGLVKLMDPNAQTDIFDLNQEFLPWVLKILSTRTNASN